MNLFLNPCRLENTVTTSAPDMADFKNPDFDVGDPSLSSSLANLDLFTTPNVWIEQAPSPTNVTDKLPAPDASKILQEQSLFLTDLADELLIHVAKWINPYIADPKLEKAPVSFSGSLLNFGLASRRLLRICEPVLYTYIQQRATTKLFPILRTILDRPDLARYVRALEVIPLERGRTWPQPGIDLSFLDDRDWKHTIIKAVESFEKESRGKLPAEQELFLTQEDPMKWVKAIEYGSWDATVALVLAHLPSLRAIKMEEGSKTFDEGFPHITKIVKRARMLQEAGQRGPMTLANLRTVLLVHRKTGTLGFDLEEPLLFLELPSVHNFTMQKILQDSLEILELPANWLASAPRFFTKQLTLKNSWIQPAVLERFISCFPPLETFYYQHGCPRQRGWGDIYDRGQGGLDEYRLMKAFEPPRIMPVLQKSKHTLTELTIINDNIEIDDWEEAELTAFPIGSLIEFSKLKYVKLSSTIAIGGTEVAVKQGFPSQQTLVESLPSSLEHLSICGIRDHEIYGPLTDLLKSKDKIVPRLKRVELHWAGEQGPLSRSNVYWSLLGERYKDIGVEIIVTTKHV